MSDLYEFLEEKRNSTLTERIDTILNQLEHSYELIYKKGSFSQYKKQIAADIYAYKINDDTLARQDLAMKINHGVGSSFEFPFLHSTICAILAEGENYIGNTDPAWSYLTYAFYYNGLSTSKELASSTNLSQESRRTNARNGGNARSTKKLLPVQLITADLLNKNRPNNGWISDKEAIKAVMPQIIKTNEFINSGLYSDKFNRTLKGWINKEGAVKDAFMNKI